MNFHFYFRLWFRFFSSGARKLQVVHIRENRHEFDLNPKHFSDNPFDSLLNKYCEIIEMGLNVIVNEYFI